MRSVQQQNFTIEHDGSDGTAEDSGLKIPGLKPGLRQEKNCIFL